MTDYETNPITSTDKPASSVVAMEDLSDTIEQLDLGKAETTKKSNQGKTGKKKSAANKAAKLKAPSQTIEAAVAAGVPPKRLDALLKEWSDYNMQQAVLRAKAEALALAETVKARRRTIAEALLACADSYGISIAEARKMFDEAMEDASRRSNRR